MRPYQLSLLMKRPSHIVTSGFFIQDTYNVRLCLDHAVECQAEVKLLEKLQEVCRYVAYVVINYYIPRLYIIPQPD